MFSNLELLYIYQNALHHSHDIPVMHRGLPEDQKTKHQGGNDPDDNEDFIFLAHIVPSILSALEFCSRINSRAASMVWLRISSRFPEK